MSSLMQKTVFFLLTLCFLCAAVASPIVIPLITVKPAKKSHQHSQSGGEHFTTSAQSIVHQGATVLTDFFSKQGVIHLSNHSSQQGQASISMHGFGANASQNNLVLLDGIPYNSFTTIGPDLNGILVQGISQIVVMPGSHASLYGDGAIGGVVNIQTRIQPKPITDITIGGGNLSQAYTSIYLSRQLNTAWAYSLGGSFYQNAHSQPRDKQADYTLNAATTYKGQRDRLDVFFLGFKNDSQIPTGIPWGQSSVASSGDYYSHVLGQLALVKNQWFMTPSWSWVSSLSTQNARTEGRIMSLATGYQHQLMWQNQLRYKKVMISGVDVEGQRYRQVSSDRVDAVTAWAGDVFSHWDLPVHRVHFILGARAAHQGVDADPNDVSSDIHTHSNVFVNEQGFKIFLPHHWRYYIRRDTNYRFAKANERVWTADNASDLKTQTGVSYETGVHWDRQQAHFLLGLYWLDLDNEIAFDPTPSAGAPFGRMFNLPPTRRLGGDIAWHTAFTQSLLGEFQASYVDGIFVSGENRGKHIPEVSAFNASVGLTYQHHQHWFVTVNEQYHSWFYAFEDLSNQGPKMPGYFLTNIIMQKNWHRAVLNLQVNNVFNKHYVRFANYFSVPTSSVEYFPGDGISFLLKLTVHLS